jgi:hypothetical protein
MLFMPIPRFSVTAKSQRTVFGQIANLINVGTIVDRQETSAHYIDMKRSGNRQA